MPHSQHSQEKSQAATDQPLHADQWQDHLAKLSQYAEQLYVDYRTQAGLCKQVAAAEWRLSTRSLALTIIMLVCFAGGLVLLWAGLLATIGIAIFSLSGSVALCALSLIVLQLLCLFWLWKNIGYISSKIGFDRTVKSARQLFNIDKEK
ncbi:hypothetical protein AAEU31_14735 [Pseudoalteromonas sp. SSMSWG5]|jgi:hypothetical protein|uniref:hypothetical protein n=1 Tax=Pseudoalteromonas TaxID=53246 RepID=UPI000C54CD08|nr:MULTISPECIES: hypothetical protein [unclassified Pseudoalteromonas]MBD57021.1 hypothetical protein [Pseudoalteromonas sp.]MBU75989.1 hypothetical protein [Pseudoalteromonadaceae bacterium]MCF2900138.1 hypothetical protein [Pseudoalteromonas sp. OFAV1]MCF2919572.1 hypothetical protein [Pseudoalteromonas sp. APAL1]MCO7251551.1 hypothetical protein [Pseudoalteromonas sp. Ps84H-4]|tara:strand:- start:610 stop:1056 length:447 start_codon:yes stop_codon:yes gene_type:complete